MAEVVTVATNKTGSLYVRHQAHHPEFDKAYWTAQHTADNDLYSQYNAPDVGIIVVGSTGFPVRPGGTRSVRIIYDRVTQNTNRTDTTGSTLGSSPSWTIWMSIVYNYSVYQSTDPKVLNTYCSQFPNSWQPVLAYLEPSNRPSLIHSSGGGSPGDTIKWMFEYPQGDARFASSGLQTLEEWIAKTEQIETTLGLNHGLTEGAVTQKEKRAGAESSANTEGSDIQCAPGEM